MSSILVPMGKFALLQLVALVSVILGLVQLVVGLMPAVLRVRAVPKKSVVQWGAAGVVYVPVGTGVLVQLVTMLVSAGLGV